ncbi:MAG: hypothetical protein LBJ87_01610, partial [bacterium]|nr:hypothetical protein [bacterium]
WADLALRMADSEVERFAQDRRRLIPNPPHAGHRPDPGRDAHLGEKPAMIRAETRISARNQL